MKLRFFVWQFERRGMGQAMKMTIRQISDLDKERVISERQYLDPNPSDIVGVLQLILNNCSDLMKREGVSLDQDSIDLKKFVFNYPSLSGVIEGHV